MKKIIDYLGQIIEMEEDRDRKYKAIMTSLNQSSKAIGESAMLFHLKELKKLIEGELNVK